MEWKFKTQGAPPDYRKPGTFRWAPSYRGCIARLTEPFLEILDRRRMHHHCAYTHANISNAHAADIVNQSKDYKKNFRRGTEVDEDHIGL